MLQQPIFSHSPRVPRNHRVYAVGDVHGRRDLLVRLHEKIVEDSAGMNELEKTIVYLGDYIDRGDDSAGVIQLFLEQPLNDFTSIHLKGNHEDLLLKFLNDSQSDDAWLLNGGWETLKSYGVDTSELEESCKAPNVYRAPWKQKVSDLIPNAHKDFLNQLRLYHTVGDYFFVHAGIRPGVRVQAQCAHDMLWIREPFLSSKADHEAVVVHGHSIVPEVSFNHNRVGLDTGAIITGHLSCLVLEEGARRLIQT